MFKKFSIAVIVSFALLFSGLFSAQVDAAAGSPGETDQQYKVTTNKWSSYFDRCIIYWENGRFIVEQPEEKRQEEVDVETPVEDSGTSADNGETSVEEDETSAKEDQTPAEEVESPAEEVESPAKEQESNGLSAFENQVVELTNVERTNQGLAPLQVDNELSRVAREKSRDMAVNGYFDHNSPTYGSPFDMMQSYGIQYRTAGENIAKGQRSPEEVVNAWMNSPGHRENILSQNFTHIGIGYVEQGNVWTQQFIGK